MNIECFFYLKYNNFILNIAFKFKNKDIIAIIGESGSGKTTLLKCIAGIIKPNKGYFCLNNIIIQNFKKNKFLKTNKREIGYVFQSPTLFPNLNVIENLNIISKHSKINKNYIIKNLFLEKLKKRKITNLSGGEKQRVCIAQIILMKPKIILLDEPFSSQDLNLKNKLTIFLKEINLLFKLPMIYVSHDINHINKLTNKIIYIHNGKILNRINL